MPTCTPGKDAVDAPGLPGAERLICAQPGSVIRSELLLGQRGARTYAANGLAAYGKALELGLASLASDKVLAGTVEIPLTAATDDIAFARQQAEARSPPIRR